jgi:hypothetical protein
MICSYFVGGILRLIILAKMICNIFSSYLILLCMICSYFVGGILRLIILANMICEPIVDLYNWDMLLEVEILIALF